MIGVGSGVLPPGIPLLRDYMKLMKTDLFLEMESFSNGFVENQSLKHDPFHQWSRRWEYPFAYSYIRRCMTSNDLLMKSKDQFKILDAGSGFTFFPYYIVQRHPNCNVHCCDHDRSLVSLFNNANKKSQRTVYFRICNLTNLGYRENSFNVIYCISVLEHASNHGKVIEQFERVLKPNGLLVATFDISLEDREKSTKEIQNLLGQLNSRFNPTDVSLKTLDIGGESEILNTRFAKDFDRDSLPWALTYSSVLSSLAKLEIPRKPFSFLTVFCGVWRKAR